MPDETQNPFENQPPSDPHPTDVGTDAPAPAADIAETPVADTAAEQPAVEPAPEDDAHVEQGAEQFAEEIVHTHESILTTMLTQLEGAAHMAKSEIESVIAKARSLFDAL